MNCRFAISMLAPVLLIAGCGKEEPATPEAGASQAAAPDMEQARQAALRLDRPDPGQYEQKMEITRFEVPGMSMKDTEAMGRMMASSQVNSFCLTEAESEKGFRDMFDEVGKGDECSYSRFNVAGGKIDAQMDCKDRNGQAATITLAGAVTRQGSDVTVNIDQSGPAQAGGPARIGMHMTTKRVGECKS